MRKLISLLAAGCFLCVSSVIAAPEGSPSTSNTAAGQPDLLSIKILPSRSQPTAGSSMGIEAELTNNSDKVLYLREKKIALYIPPELGGPLGSYNDWWGAFPTEHVWEDKSAQPPVVETWNGTLTMRPGSKYRVIWQSGAADTEGTSIIRSNVRAISSELRFIFFSPGDYLVSVVAEYWTDPSLPSRDYYTTTQSATVHVVAPQSVIVFGAALGGLVAFILFPTRRRVGMRSTATGNRYLLMAYNFGTELTGAAGSMLLSAITTILIARISGSEFLIRITVADFWGAIAIGFIASYAGAKALDKLLPPGVANGGGSTPTPGVGSTAAAGDGSTHTPAG